MVLVFWSIIARSVHTVSLKCFVSFYILLGKWLLSSDGNWKCSVAHWGNNGGNSCPNRKRKDLFTECGSYPFPLYNDVMQTHSCFVSIYSFLKPTESTCNHTCTMCNAWENFRIITLIWSLFKILNTIKLHGMRQEKITAVSLTHHFIRCSQRWNTKKVYSGMAVIGISESPVVFSQKFCDKLKTTPHS